jgi:hypothetical protein
VGPGVRRMLLWVNGVCVIGLLAAGLTAAFLFEEKKSYPDAWDPRVVPLVQYVERERGFTFEHPVHIDFLTPSEYSERTRADEGSLGAEDVEDVDQGEGLLRAMGLITNDVGLLTRSTSSTTPEPSRTTTASRSGSRCGAASSPPSCRRPSCTS